MSTANVIQIGSEGERAFQRIKPILDRLQDNIKEARRVVGREYKALPENEKKSFRKKITDEYGWSDRRIKEFAYIEKKLADKKKIIEQGAARRTPLDELSTRTLTQICTTSDDILRKGVKAGLFKNPVTSEDIKRFRKTGQLPTDLVKHVAKTELQKLREHMQAAAKQLDQFSISMDRITRIMHDEGITNAKGQASTALVAAFERACTQMASVNPATSKRAFQILRGEA